MIVANLEDGRIAPMAANENKHAMLATISRIVNVLYFIEFTFAVKLLKPEGGGMRFKKDTELTKMGKWQPLDCCPSMLR